MKVEEIMTKNPIIVDPEDTLLDVLEKLKRKDSCFVFSKKYYGGLTRFHILKRRIPLSTTKAKTIAVPTPKLSPEEEIKDLARKMIEADFYFLPVFKDERIVGEVSWTNLAEARKNILSKIEVGDVMSRDVIFAYPNDSIGRVIGLMRKNKVSSIPIIEENKVVGIITSKEIVEKVLSPRDRQEFGEIRGEKILPLKTPCREIMDKVIPIVNLGNSLYYALTLMKELKKDVCLVTKKGKLVGIITRKDILETLISEEREENLNFCIASNFEMKKEWIMPYINEIWEKFGKFLEWAYFFIYVKRVGRSPDFRYITRIKLRAHPKTWNVWTENYSFQYSVKQAFDILEREILEEKEELLERHRRIEMEL